MTCEGGEWEESCRGLVNARGLQLEYPSELHEGLSGSKTMIWRVRIGLGLGLCRWIEYRMHRLESCAGWRKGSMKKLTKVFSYGLVILKKLGMIGLLKGYTVCGRVWD